MGRKCCVQKLLWTSETISVLNMFSPCLSLEFSCIELVIQWTICRHILGLLMQHNMTKDCSLIVIYQFSIWKLQAQNIGRTCCVRGRTKQQNGTKCNKTNKTQQNSKIFVVAKQNNKKFCSCTTKEQNSKKTKQQNNKIFCFYTTKQQNILLVHNKTIKY